MAVLRIWKGSVLEENIARTAGSIGESVAAGAIFTLPAFVIPARGEFRAREGLLEIHVDDDCGRHPGSAVCFPGPPRHGGRSFASVPESLAAAEIHKAGSAGRKPPAIFSGISA
jgi:hypothetical protein